MSQDVRYIVIKPADVTQGMLNRSTSKSLEEARRTLIKNTGLAALVNPTTEYIILEIPVSFLMNSPLFDEIKWYTNTELMEFLEESELVI